MPPPPPASLPLPERLMALAKTLQFAWFAGHLTLILCTTWYSFSFVRFNSQSGTARFAYRTTFISAAVTYGIVVYKVWRARSKANAKPLGLVGAMDENVQYLVMALVWLFTPQYILAMLPYAVYSVFHVLTYTRANLIPTIQPPRVLTPASNTTPNSKPTYAPNPLADRIGTFVKDYYDASMSVVSGLEILLWLRLLLAAIFFQRRSWILLAIYTAFLRARVAQSTHTQTSFAQLEARGDSLVGAQGTPPVARQVWDGVKTGARQFHAATDLRRYTGGTVAPKKTS